MKSLVRASILAVPFVTAAFTVSPALGADDPKAPAPPASSAPATPPPAATPPSTPPAAPSAAPAAAVAGDAKPGEPCACKHHEEGKPCACKHHEEGKPCACKHHEEGKPCACKHHEGGEHQGDGPPCACDHHGAHDGHGHGGHKGPGDHPHMGPHGDHDHHPHANPRASDSGEWPDVRKHLELNLGPVQLAPVVLMQAQAIPYVGSDALLQSADPAERGGFRMRRARFGVGGRLFRRVSFRISGEYNSDSRGTALLRDAWFGYDKFEPLQVFAGAQALPFTRSGTLDWSGSAMVDRPFSIRAMAPGQQLGLSARGNLFKGALSYNVGVYNGLQRSDHFFAGYTENASINGNRFDGLTYVAHLGSSPFGEIGNSLQDLKKGPFRLSVGAGVFYSNGGTRNILGVSGDVLAHWKGLHLLAEFVTNKSSPRTVPTQPSGQIDTAQSLAVVGEVGYMILKERLGVNTRVEWMNPNTSVKDESDSIVAGGGVSYHLLHNLLKTQLEFTHRQELTGKALKNDSLVLQLQLNL
jgi:hypothetical protein